MKKIYEATGKNKREIIEINNDYAAHQRYINRDRIRIGISDMVLLARLKEFPFDGKVNTTWNINGLIMPYPNNEDSIIVAEPLEEQVNNGLNSISPEKTTFKGQVFLSSKATILVPLKIYDSMSAEDKKKIDSLNEEYNNIRFYIGEEDLATEMLLNDKGFIYLSIDENGYKTEGSDAREYAKFLIEKQEHILEQLELDGRIAVFKRKIKGFRTGNYSNQGTNFKQISGMTQKVEGDISIDDETYATTNIGKIRENQEDAVLLIKDKENPKFKMIVVADRNGWRTKWRSGKRHCYKRVKRLVRKLKPRAEKYL